MPYRIKIEAVIFDMDGLLIDSEPLWLQAEQHVMVKYGFDSLLQQHCIDTTGLRVDEVVRLWANFAIKSEIDLDTVVNDIIDIASELIQQNLPILPGVVHALELCKKNDLLIGLASASPKKLINEVVKSLGISEYFDVIVSAEYMLYSKPHPEVYLEVANQLGISPLACVSLEDSINGMIAAKSARMRSIVVADDTNVNKINFKLADYHLNSLSDLTRKHIT